MPDDVRRDDISYKIGDDRPIAWELLEVDGEALAAGGFHAYAQVRDRPGGLVLHEWSTKNDRATLTKVEDDAGSRWYVQLLVDDSRDWLWERGSYDLYVVDPQDHAQPIAEGTWVNRPAMTEWSDDQ